MHLALAFSLSLESLDVFVYSIANTRNRRSIREGLVRLDTAVHVVDSVHTMCITYPSNVYTQREMLSYLVTFDNCPSECPMPRAKLARPFQLTPQIVTRRNRANPSEILTNSHDVTIDSQSIFQDWSSLQNGLDHFYILFNSESIKKTTFISATVSQKLLQHQSTTEICS